MDQALPNRFDDDALITILNFNFVTPRSSFYLVVATWLCVIMDQTHTGGDVLRRRIEDKAPDPPMPTYIMWEGEDG